MTDVFNLPAVRWKDGSFDPIRPANISRMEGRLTERSFFGTPFWRANYISTHLSYDDFGRVDAFRMQMDGGGVFQAYDPLRPRPIAQDTKGGRPLSGTRAGGGSFDGTATVTSRTATTLSVSGLPAAFRFRAGDYVEVRKSSLMVSLHRIVQDVTATSGGTVTLQVRHQIDTANFTLPLTANFERPSCLMQVDPSSWSLGKPVGGERSVSFTGQEVFLS